jgi:7,8-dihydropterin-6-yl-methyl-4-(beta-D-ribofuranosyl)aminobenzene 5'-phosphate synthase
MILTKWILGWFILPGISSSGLCMSGNTMFSYMGSPGEIHIMAENLRDDLLNQDSIKITILYDNYSWTEGSEPDWGFSCLIEGAEKTILFDTGTRADILQRNMERLNVDIKKIQQIVISHNHGDHTGGLSWVLEKNPNTSVYFPVSFPESFSQEIEKVNARAIRVDKSMEICKNVFSTGEMGDSIREHSLILDTPKGLVIVTGCSHQGVVEILRLAKRVYKKDIYLIFGGFHLMNHSDSQVKDIISEFRKLGVSKCGPTHCTGDRAIQLFKEDYKENYMRMGVGKIVKIPVH